MMEKETPLFTVNPFVSVLLIRECSLFSLLRRHIFLPICSLLQPRCAIRGKGERLFDWARLPVAQGGLVDGRHWLVFRRCLDDPHELAYFLVWAPPDTPLSTMLAAIGARWHIEED
jgi:hypothetical protein